MSTAAGLAGGAGYLIGAGLYVKAIWAPGRQKPDRLSWLGWSIQATALTLPLSQALSPTGPAGYATVTALALPAAQALSSWLIFADAAARPGQVADRLAGGCDDSAGDRRSGDIVGGLGGR